MNIQKILSLFNKKLLRFANLGYGYTSHLIITAYARLWCFTIRASIILRNSLASSVGSHRFNLNSSHPELEYEFYEIVKENVLPNDI